MFGTSEAAQDISFPEMKKQEELGAIVQADPDVATVAMALGAGVGSTSQNNGRMFITLKPRDERDASVFQMIARLRPKLAKVKGARLYLQAAQDVTVGARAARTQFQYTVQDANLDELNVWAPRILDKLQVVAGIARRRDRSTGRRNDAAVTIDRDMASRFGIQPQLIDDTLYDAFGQRQVAQYFTQINTYDVIEEILPSLQRDPETLGKLYIRSPGDRPDGADERLRQMDHESGGAAVDQPSRPISCDHDQLQSRQGVALGQATSGDPGRRARIATAARARRRRSRATRRRSRIRCRPCRC